MIHISSVHPSHCSMGGPGAVHFPGPAAKTPTFQPEFRRPEGEKVHWPRAPKAVGRFGGKFWRPFWERAPWGGVKSEKKKHLQRIRCRQLVFVGLHGSNKGRSWLLAAWREVLLELLLIDLSNLPAPKRRCHLPHTPTEGPTTSLIDVNLKVTSRDISNKPPAGGGSVFAAMGKRGRMSSDRNSGCRLPSPETFSIVTIVAATRNFVMYPNVTTKSPPS